GIRDATVTGVQTCALPIYAFAGASFWIRDARSTWFLYHKLVFVLGGMLLPLQVLPAWLRTIAECLPFVAMAYAPARLASGHIEQIGRASCRERGWRAGLVG